MRNVNQYNNLGDHNAYLSELRGELEGNPDDIGTIMDICRSCIDEIGAGRFKSQVEAYVHGNMQNYLNKNSFVPARQRLMYEVKWSFLDVVNLMEEFPWLLYFVEYLYIPSSSLPVLFDICAENSDSIFWDTLDFNLLGLSVSGNSINISDMEELLDSPLCSNLMYLDVQCVNGGNDLFMSVFNNVNLGVREIDLTGNSIDDRVLDRLVSGVEERTYFLNQPMNCVINEEKLSVVLADNMFSGQLLNVISRNNCFKDISIDVRGNDISDSEFAEVATYAVNTSPFAADIYNPYRFAFYTPNEYEDDDWEDDDVSDEDEEVAADDLYDI